MRTTPKCWAKPARKSAPPSRMRSISWPPTPVDIETLLEEALALGRANFTVMEALDAANTGAYGTPTPTAVRITPVAGKAILVSGHDLRDLRDPGSHQDKGINVYTHGEMLPAHSYPKLKAYPHLAGNYGGAWQNQQTEFADFPGADRDDVELPDRAERALPQPHLHRRPGGLAGPAPHPERRFLRCRAGGPGAARLRGD